MAREESEAKSAWALLSWRQRGVSFRGGEAGWAQGRWEGCVCGEGQKSFRNPTLVSEKVLQYISDLYRSMPPHLYRCAFLACKPLRKETRQYTSHFYCGTPRSCTAAYLPLVRQYHCGQNHYKNTFQNICFGTMNFVKITKQSLYKANSFACSLANMDKPVSATLQRKCTGGIIFVIITKIITKIVVPRKPGWYFWKSIAVLRVSRK